MRSPFWIAALMAMGCSVEETKTAPQPAAPQATTSVVRVSPMHDEPELGLRVPLAQGTTFKMWHFDSTLPVEKFRHEIQLSGDYGVQVVIDVWDNPQHLDVAHWVAHTISGFFNDQTKRTERAMSRARGAGLFFEQPPSEGGDAQAMAAYVTRDRAYLFFCPHALEDTAARAVFDEIVDAFDTEVTR